MAEGMSNAIINLGDLAKPATELISRISDAVGVLYEPRHIKRVAKANAAASIIEANAQIEISDIQRDALQRLAIEEAQYQENMVNITAKAIPQLHSDSDPGAIDHDWIVNFFDKSRIVSNEEMQILWSKILAGEANEPGAFTKRTVNFLNDMDLYDAQMFSSICNFVVEIDKQQMPVIYYQDDEIYYTNGVTFEALTHLDSIGLIQFDPFTTFTLNVSLENCFLNYHGTSLKLRTVNGILETGNANLSSVGEDLYSVCDSKKNDDFIEFLKNKWKFYLRED